MSPSLTVATERVFRSDETPALRLTTRNVQAVTIRAFQLDLPTYFRKQLAAGEVEKLDTALIDPDSSRKFSIPQYVKYRELDSTVEVPLPAGAKAGAMIVTVSSDTLEATTLVLQSDLDVITKASADGLFVFAENLRTGQPWAGAKLLLANQEQVFAEVTTGPDGVFQGPFDEPQAAGDLRVLALADGHVASNLLAFDAERTAEPLSDLGYVYTDRPAYQAGQRVYVRGCIRAVRGEGYAVEKGKQYTLSLLDPRNRQLWQQPVASGEFGSFAADFPLPPSSPPGEYHVQVRDQQNQNYAGTFQVYVPRWSRCG